MNLHVVDLGQSSFNYRFARRLDLAAAGILDDLETRVAKALFIVELALLGLRWEDVQLLGSLMVEQVIETRRFTRVLLAEAFPPQVVDPARWRRLLGLTS